MSDKERIRITILSEQSEKVKKIVRRIEKITDQLDGEELATVLILLELDRQIREEAGKIIKFPTVGSLQR